MSNGDVKQHRSGILEEKDGEEFDFMLPPRLVIGPDENGIKTVIEYAFDEEGNVVETTATNRLRKLPEAMLTKLEMAVLAKRAMETRYWTRCRKSHNDDVGLYRHKAFGKSKKNKGSGDALTHLVEGGAFTNLCLTCGNHGDHLTSSCPYKDLAAPVETFGHKRVEVAIVDPKEGVSRGVGFVNFVNKEDADIVINMLDGYGLDNLILRADCWTPIPKQMCADSP
uniref:Eukaryotic translation initiation factor 3 subunit G N-terminal domain-containing protein n=1 Tax=Kalanchoe fedtschenkoi TaxID=63787 RepID=A0A7N0UL97_KALFE